MANDENNRGTSPSSGRICLLVLGMHRSGTSALSRVMALLGADLPKVLMPANASNEAGYWESNKISRVNDALIDSAGSSWDDWLAFDRSWRSTSKAQDFKTKALAALDSDFEASSFFVLKDPRICRIAPFWLDVLEEAGVRPLVVVPVRNPLEVAASLERRDGFPPELGHLIWLRNVLEAEAASRGRPRFHCSYDQLMSNWTQLAARAEATLDISWPRTPEQIAPEVDAFLAGKLHHHRETPKGVTGNPALSSWLRDTFEILNRWAAEGEDPADFPALDRIRTAFDEAAPAFAQLVSACRRQSQLIAENESLQEALTAATAEMAGSEHAETQMRAARQQLLEAQTAVAAEKAGRERAETQLMTARQQLLEAQTAAANERSARARAQEALSKRFDEIAALSRLLRDTQALVRQRQDMILRSARFLPAFLRYRLQMAAIRRSGLFDAEWYGRVYKDVTTSGMDPLRHFVQYGAREGRAPSAALGSGPIATGERRKQA